MIRCAVAQERFGVQRRWRVVSRMAGRIMESHSLATYPPLNTLKRVAEDIWIVDGPVIRFGPPLLKMPFSTRMTIIRIGGDLLIHSPTPLTAELKTEVEGIGGPRGCRWNRDQSKKPNEPQPVLRA
jgi:hypothetical protein